MSHVSILAVLGFTAGPAAIVSPAVVVLTKGVSNVMVRKTLKCVVVTTCAVLALAGLSAAADDKKDDKAKPALSGVWVLQGGEPKIEFADKGVMKISPHGKDEVILLIFTYTVEKDGRIKAKLTEIEGKEDVKEKAKGSLPVGLTFSFKWQVKGDIAILDEVKGDKAEALKAHVEGKYEKK